jgi:hypothetical protein
MSKAPKITTSSMLHDDTKALFQPWRHGAFKSDIFVQAMKPAARWMYATLLHESFDYSTRPYLPDDDSILWMLAGCESKTQWDQHKDSIRVMFTPVIIDGQKLLGQKRVLDDWQRLAATRVARTESARVAGLASAAKRQRHVDDTLTNRNETSTKSNQGKEREVKEREVKGSEVKRSKERERQNPASADADGPVGTSYEAKPSPSLVSPVQAPVKGNGSGQDETERDGDRAVEYVIERSKALSNGNAGFSKTAKIDMIGALRELGRTTREEIDYAINEKLKLCSDDDPTSYVIFGSSIAADFVATVRSYRQRTIDANQKIQDERAGEKWMGDFRAIWDDLSIDLGDWFQSHYPVGDAIHGSQRLLEDAEVYRKDLVKRAVKEAKPEQTAEDLFGPTPIQPKPNETIVVPTCVINSELATVTISAGTTDAELAELFKKHGVKSSGVVRSGIGEAKS